MGAVALDPALNFCLSGSSCHWDWYPLGSAQGRPLIPAPWSGVDCAVVGVHPEVASGAPKRESVAGRGSGRFPRRGAGRPLGEPRGAPGCGEAPRGAGRPRDGGGGRSQRALLWRGRPRAPSLGPRPGSRGSPGHQQVGVHPAPARGAPAGAQSCARPGRARAGLEVAKPACPYFSLFFKPSLASGALPSPSGRERILTPGSSSSGRVLVQGPDIPPLGRQPRPDAAPRVGYSAESVSFNILGHHGAV